MKIIILGPPGAGKGTQAKKLAKKLNLKHLSPGDLLRKEHSKKTPLGLKAYPYWNKGNLVPDKLVIKLVEKHLPKNNYILDGYPRTVNEAKHLDKKQPTDFVLYLQATEGVIVKRLLKRAILENRTDDTLQVIKRRINVYEKKTRPVLTYYKKKPLTFDGNKQPNILFKAILKKLRKK